MRVLSMFYGSVLFTRIRGKGLWLSLGPYQERLLKTEALDNIEKASFVLGCELWTENVDALLALVKEYIVDLWEVRKVKLYPGSLPVLGWGSEGWHCGGGQEGREMVSLVSSVTQGE